MTTPALTALTVRCKSSVKARARIFSRNRGVYSKEMRVFSRVRNEEFGQKDRSQATLYFCNGLLALTLAYILGSIPTGYWLGLTIRKIDIRQHGSKNIGATNTLRVLGKKLDTIFVQTQYPGKSK